MKKIEVDTDVLKSSTDEIRSDIKSVRDRIDQTYEGINVLNGMWDGPANDEFNKSFMSDYERMTEICAELDSYAAKMDEAKSKYDEGEAKIAAVIAGIRF